MTVLFQPSDNISKITLTQDNADDVRKLVTISSADVKATTNFLTDKVNETNDYYTQLVYYNAISASTTNYIENKDQVDINKRWTLNGNNKTMCLDMLPLTKADSEFSKYWLDKTGQPDLKEYGNAAITYEFYVKGLLQKIYNLSAEIYEKPHMPSYVGMIVHTNSCATEDAMRNIYGKNTRWEQILFAIVCGSARNGNPEENTYKKYGELAIGKFKPGNSTGYGSGGEEYVKLEERHMMNHTHGFKADTEEFTLSWSGKATGNGSQYIYFVNSINYRGKAGHGGQMGAGKKSLKSISAKVSGGITISTSKIYGSTMNTTKTIYLASGTAINSTPQHINMPPFETKYVWKRIS